MSKMIQKQIKRSMPAVLIFVLISSMVMGIVFNYDIRLTELPKELGSKVKLAFNLPEANAAKNWATTTVTVRNAPPTVGGGGFAAEVVASTSTSPVNVADSISFTATGDDPEGQDYYLIVCSGAVKANNGSAPTCNGGTTFCVSGATTDNTPATCTYSPVAAALPESQSWNAYACDAHASEADCSAANTGTGDSGSPFFVNHRPTINTVSTTDNNKNPGQTFTMTATTTDTDSQGGFDIIQIDFCKNAGWATSTGCTNPADLICTATTTSTGVAVAASCVSTSTLAAVPTPHGSYTYYAYAKDWHALAPSTNGVSSTYSVNDVSPVMGTVYINGGSAITVFMKDMASSTASSSVQATDNNGCADMTSATSTIYWSAVANGPDCSADPNSCYQMASTKCAQTSCVGAVADYVCSTTLAYLTNPTDASSNNSRSGDNWLARITVHDGTYAASAISGTGVDVNTLTALNVSETAVPYGTIRSSFNSGTSNATTTIVNYGNSPINTNVKGTDMTKAPDSIAVTEQKWNLANFDYSGGGTQLQLTDALAAIQVSKPTAGDLSSPIYWGINIPAGKPSGLYSGTNTFSVLLYDGASW